MATTTQVCIDCYNGNVSVIFDDLRHVFSSYDRFVELTGFERGEVNMVSYELERNLFVVEYVGGIIVAKVDAPEVQWVAQNIENIKQAAVADQAAFRETPSTLRYHRNGLLYSTDWLFVRHSEQLLMGTEPSLTTQQIQELNAYRQALRDMPDTILSNTVLNEEEWPVPPAFLS